MTTPQVKAWPLEPGLLSEGPRWDGERQELLWVDILDRGFHRATVTADGGPDQIRTMALDRHVGAVAPVAGGGYVLAAGQGFLFVDEEGSVCELAQPEAGRVDVRMNARGEVYVFEVNPLPGLTPDYSDLVLISKAAGIDYRTLIGEILGGALRRMREQKRKPGEKPVERSADKQDKSDKPAGGNGTAPTPQG